MAATVSTAPIGFRSHDGTSQIRGLIWAPERPAGTRAPAPRGVQACCGMSIAFGDPAEVEAARDVAAERGLAITEFVQVAGSRDARRDRFC